MRWGQYFLYSQLQKSKNIDNLSVSLIEFQTCLTLQNVHESWQQHEELGSSMTQN